jgi:hypothetical protein
MRLIRGVGFPKLLGPLLAATFLFVGVSSNVFAVSKKDLRRIDDRGPVEVVSVYLNPLEKVDDDTLAFEITLDTHSVNLSQYKLQELSTLKIGGGAEIKASGWKNPGGGGHHISGTVVFETGALSSADTIELIVRNIGGIEERIFTWEPPLN